MVCCWYHRLLVRVRPVPTHLIILYLESIEVRYGFYQLLYMFNFYNKQKNKNCIFIIVILYGFFHYEASCQSCKKVQGCIPENRKWSVVIPVYKDKGDPMECSPYRWIKLLEYVSNGEGLWITVWNNVRSELKDNEVSRIQFVSRLWRSCYLQCFDTVVWLFKNSIWPVENLVMMCLWLFIWERVQMICIWSSWCHCHSIISCFVKIWNGLPFWCWFTQVVLDL